MHNEASKIDVSQNLNKNIIHILGPVAEKPIDLQPYIKKISKENHQGLDNSQPDSELPAKKNLFMKDHPNNKDNIIASSMKNQDLVWKR